MYMHSTYAHAPHERTSLVTPPQAVERSVVAAVVAVAHPRSPPIERLASVAKTAAIERPGRVSVGTGQHAGEGWLGVESALRRRCGGLYAYEGAVKWLSSAKYGVKARLVPCRGRRSELRRDGKRSGACTCAARMRMNRTSDVRCGRRRGRWRRQRPWQYAHDRHSSSCRPSEAQAATIERPGRVGEGPG